MTVERNAMDASLTKVAMRTGVAEDDWFAENMVTWVSVFGVVDAVPVWGAVPPAESKNMTRPLLMPFAPTGPV
jgi:hypothetical protein